MLIENRNGVLELAPQPIVECKRNKCWVSAGGSWVFRFGHIMDRMILLIALIVVAGRILHHSLERVGQFPLVMERASYFAPLKPPCCDSVQAIQIPIILPNKS